MTTAVLGAVPRESRLLVAAGAALWIGAGLLLARWRRVGRPGYAARVSPFLQAGSSSHRGGAALFGTGLSAFARAVGDRLTAVLGLSPDVAGRLARIHSPLDVTAFRLRQLGWSVAAVLVAVALESGMGAPALVGLVTVPAAGLLGYAGTDAALRRRCRVYDRRRTVEMPVIAEQLAMLVSSGYSLGTAVGRIAQRGDGACARDLRRVHARVAQGVTEQQALREWAARAASGPVERMVAVLVLSSETGDLGRLLAEEARSIRRSVQREMVEVMDRRSQQVWIPVTVAALVPGVIFLAVPFVSALRMFAGG